MTNAHNASYPNTFLISSGTYLTNGLVLKSVAGNIDLLPAGQIDLRACTTINGGLNSTQDRPAVVSGTITGEFRGVSDNNTFYTMDDGFLRLSAGGGTNANTKSYIDLSGYTAFANAAGRPRARSKANDSTLLGWVTPVLTPK